MKMEHSILVIILLIVHGNEGTLFKSSLNCAQYSTDLEILKSLPFHVSIINESESYPAGPYVTLNSQRQAVVFLAAYVEEALKVYCLKHLRSLTLYGPYSPWHVPSEIGNLTQLTHLSLENIAGDEIPETIGKLKLLSYLSLGGKELEELPASLAALDNLRSLWIAAPLRKLPLSISILPLSSLTIHSGAKFSVIPKDFFKNLNPTLRYLDMELTHLKSLDAFSDLTKLDFLVAHVENLKIFPSQFTFLSALRQLVITGNNQFSSLPQNFSKTLVTLGLNNNNFIQIPSQILFSKNLNSLNLGSNQIVDMSAITLTKSPLTSLGLSNNSIETLPDEISYLTETLNTIFLSSNKLTTVPADVLVKMKKLRQVNLENNRITADEISRLKAIFATNPKIMVFF